MTTTVPRSELTSEETGLSIKSSELLDRTQKLLEGIGRHDKSYTTPENQSVLRRAYEEGLDLCDRRFPRIYPGRGLELGIGGTFVPISPEIAIAKRNLLGMPGEVFFPDTLSNCVEAAENDLQAQLAALRDIRAAIS